MFLKVKMWTFPYSFLARLEKIFPFLAIQISTPPPSSRPRLRSRYTRALCEQFLRVHAMSTLAFNFNSLNAEETDGAVNRAFSIVDFSWTWKIHENSLPPPKHDSRMNISQYRSFDLDLNLFCRSYAVARVKGYTRESFILLVFSPPPPLSSSSSKPSTSEREWEYAGSLYAERRREKIPSPIVIVVVGAKTTYETTLETTNDVVYPW